MKREGILCWGGVRRRCKFTIKQQNLTRKIQLVGLWVADETDALLCSAVLGEEGRAGHRPQVEGSGAGRSQRAMLKVIKTMTLAIVLLLESPPPQVLSSPHKDQGAHP